MHGNWPFLKDFLEKKECDRQVENLKTLKNINFKGLDKENPSTEEYAEVGQNLHDAFSKIGNIDLILCCSFFLKDV